MQVDIAAGGAPLVDQPAAVGDHHRQQVGEVAEQVEQDIGDPGTDHAAGVVDLGAGAGMRPAGVARQVAGERDQQVDGQCAQDEQGTFAQAARDLVGEFPGVALVTPCLGQCAPRDELRI